MKNVPVIVAISGVKNSGKTTLIGKMIPILKEMNLKVAVIKHDGHQFTPDVPGTDSCLFYQQGADFAAVFDSEKYMMTGRYEVDETFLMQLCRGVDLILLEGMKDSDYPKFEVIRSGNSDTNVCTGEKLLGVISDFTPALTEEVPVYDLNDPEKIAELIAGMIKMEEGILNTSSKLMIYGEHYFFGPGVYQLLTKIEELGSIRKASIDMNMSYTKAWKMVNRVEEETGMEFLVRSTGGKKGGSSFLTEDAKKFLRAYQLYREEMACETERVFAKYFSEFDKKR